MDQPKEESCMHREQMTQRWTKEGNHKLQISRDRRHQASCILSEEKSEETGGRNVFQQLSALY
ncbi:MAG: hypothetical protein WBZ36_19380 [Candidatus Nitrosopolaris sp.]